VRKLLLASALLLAAICFPVAAQDDRIGSLAVYWGPELSKGRLITLADDSGKIVEKFDWSKKNTPFFTTVALPAHDYTIHLPGPIGSVQLQTTKNTTTFLQVDQHKTDNGDVGIQITSWAGTPNEAIRAAIENLKESGESLEPVKLAPVGYSLSFNTEPPWPIPPRPPKP
jgi:hypothetical protein